MSDISHRLSDAHWLLDVARAANPCARQVELPPGRHTLTLGEAETPMTAAFPR